MSGNKCGNCSIGKTSRESLCVGVLMKLFKDIEFLTIFKDRDPWMVGTGLDGMNVICLNDMNWDHCTANEQIELKFPIMASNVYRLNLNSVFQMTG